MLQQNWALVDATGNGEATVFFVSDASAVFDRMTFPSFGEAAEALARNGFTKFAGDKQLQSFLRTPKPPFREGTHPNDRIYSSGRFWR